MSFVHARPHQSPTVSCTVDDPGRALLDCLADPLSRFDRGPENGLEARLDALFARLEWRVAFVEICEEGFRRGGVQPSNEPTGVTPFHRAPHIDAACARQCALYDRGIPALPVICCPVVENGRVVRVLVVEGPDLTRELTQPLQLAAQILSDARRKREDEARLCAAEQRLAEDDRLRLAGQSAAYFAHEVLNPLQAVVHSAELLALGIDGAPRINELVSTLRDEASRLTRIGREWLKALPEPKQLADAPLQEVATRAIAEARLTLRRGTTARCDLSEVVLEIEPDLVVRADRLLLHHAIVNLVKNALQHATERQPIQVSARPVGDRVRLVVYNPGPPIPPESADRVLNAGHSTRPDGHGFGLAFVVHALEAMGGSAQLDDTKTGVAFSLWLEAGAARTGADNEDRARLG